MNKKLIAVYLLMAVLLVFLFVLVYYKWTKSVILSDDVLLVIDDEVWAVGGVPSLINCWNHRMVSINGEWKTIHISEMGKLFRSGRVKIWCQRGDPNWETNRQGFAIALH